MFCFDIQNKNARLRIPVQSPAAYCCNMIGIFWNFSFFGFPPKRCPPSPRQMHKNSPFDRMNLPITRSEMPTLHWQDAPTVDELSPFWLALFTNSSQNPSGMSKSAVSAAQCVQNCFTATSKKLLLEWLKVGQPRSLMV